VCNTPFLIEKIILGLGSSIDQTIYNEDYKVEMCGMKAFALDKSNHLWTFSDFDENWRKSVEFGKGHRYINHSSPHLSFSGSVGLLPTMDNWNYIDSTILTYSLDSGATWSTLSKEEFNVLVGESEVNGLRSNYDLDKTLYVYYHDKVYEVRKSKSFLEFVRQDFTLNGEKTSLLDITDNGESSYALIRTEESLTHSKYLLAKETSGRLTTVYEAGTEENRYFAIRFPKMIQLDKYVAFSYGYYLYTLDKNDNSVVLVTDSFINGIQSIKLVRYAEILCLTIPEENMILEEKTTISLSTTLIIPNLMEPLSQIHMGLTPTYGQMEE